MVERLILALGLGSSGQHISVEGRPAPPVLFPYIVYTKPDNGVNETLSRKSRSNCDSGQICHHVTSSHRGTLQNLQLLEFFVHRKKIIVPGRPKV